MNWTEFREASGDLGLRGEALLKTTGVCIVGTLRADGWPRISPCEVILEEGELMLGMMWRSWKASDLQRDPRVTVHSTQCDPDGTSGDFKVYGYAREIPDGGVDPARPQRSHLFAVDIRSAALISFGDDRTAVRWDQDGGLMALEHPSSRRG
jgi:hypothetical protein